MATTTQYPVAMLVDEDGTKIDMGAVGTGSGSGTYGTPLLKTLVAATAQEIFAASASRKRVWIKSRDSVEVIFLRFDGVAASGGTADYQLVPLQELILNATPTTAISAYSVAGTTMWTQAVT